MVQALRQLDLILFVPSINRLMPIKDLISFSIEIHVVLTRFLSHATSTHPTTQLANNIITLHSMYATLVHNHLIEHLVEQYMRYSRRYRSRVSNIRCYGKLCHNCATPRRLWMLHLWSHLLSLQGTKQHSCQTSSWCSTSISTQE